MFELYRHHGVMQAVTEFFTMHEQKFTPVKIDSMAVYIQKRVAFAVDMKWYLDFNRTRTVEKNLI